MRFILGLTGQTGAGKSLASTVAQKNGYYVIDCDKVAHSVIMRENTKTALVNAFGGGILENGEINRKKLALAAFESADKTELLNKTVLPFIVDEINLILSKNDSSRVLLDAPTLYESGANTLCDVTVGVVADKEIRYQRIVARDNLTKEQAVLRIDAGKPDEFYYGQCDYVIKNNGTDTEFINNFEKLLNDILIGRQ